jgi:hypothetical protein
MRKMSPLAGLAWLASLGSEEDRVRERERQGVLWAFRGVEFLELWDLEFQLLGGDEMSAWLLAVLAFFFFDNIACLLALFQLHSLPGCLLGI